MAVTQTDTPTPAADDEAQDADLARRDKTLSEELDDLEEQVKPKTPKAPPIGAMF